MLDLSIILPVASGEKMTQILIDQIKHLVGNNFEIIVAACIGDLDVLNNLKNTSNIIVSYSKQGRAQQLNSASAIAKGKFLWFVHIDSVLDNMPMNSLKPILDHENGKVLWFFNLRFYGGTRALMKINEVGVWFRSHFFRMPFGDQGFLIKKSYFAALGGYPEGLPYGEDHMLVWQSRKNGFKIKSTGMTIYTSAIKYQNTGWGKLTLTYLVRTYAQAIPAALGLHPALKRVKL